MFYFEKKLFVHSMAPRFARRSQDTASSPGVSLLDSAWSKETSVKVGHAHGEKSGVGSSVRRLYDPGEICSCRGGSHRVVGCQGCEIWDAQHQVMARCICRGGPRWIEGCPQCPSYAERMAVDGCICC